MGRLNLKRGEVYLVNFDPTVGREIQKTRPAIVLQNDISNRHSDITIVAAISSKFGPKLYPTEVLIKTGEAGMKVESVILLNQIRSIDHLRIIKRLGNVAKETLKSVDRGIAISMGLVTLE
ncbi:MAG: type II toxin-antitoxin system PemK/MazF family toxin [Pyrinomonadaceae bacterium]